VSADEPPYESDSEAWNAYLAEGNAKQARKRVSVDVLLRDEQGRVLLVDPRYKPDWDLPGGMAEANEPLHDTARRELREELGLEVRLGALLCIDWVEPHGPWDDLLNFIFDGGALSEAEAASLRLADDELRAFEFCDGEQVRRRLRPDIRRRITAACQTLATGQLQYLQDGRPQ
jgi:8-oxo-dGTP diphosphatase